MDTENLTAESLTESSFDYSSGEEDDLEIFEKSWLDKHTRMIAALVVLVWILVGVVVGVGMQGWDYATSFYVIVQICTTVGYGDQSMGDAYHLFMIVYIFIGTVVTAGVISEVVDAILTTAVAEEKAFFKKVVEKEKAFFGKDQSADPAATGHGGAANAHHVHMKAALKRQGMDTLRALAGLVFGLLLWALFFSIYEECTCSYDADKIEGCDGTSFETCEATGGKQMSFLAAVYFGVVTFSTVGFGDYTPHTHLGRIVATFGMLLGVGSYVNFVTSSSSLITSLKSHARKAKKLNIKLFRKLDANKTNYVTREEFRNFFLVSQGIVSEEQLHFIDHAFDSMDKKKTGILEIDEVEDMMREQTEQETGTQPAPAGPARTMVARPVA